MHLALCLLIVAFVHCLFIHWSFIVPLSFIVPSSLIHCSLFVRFCGHAILRCLCCCGRWAVVTISSTIFWLLCRCCCLRCPLPLSSSSSLLSLIILVPIPCPHPASLSCVLIFFYCCVISHWPLSSSSSISLVFPHCPLCCPCPCDHPLLSLVVIPRPSSPPSPPPSMDSMCWPLCVLSHTNSMGTKFIPISLTLQHHPPRALCRRVKKKYWFPC